jgi:hypothetical protein
MIAIPLEFSCQTRFAINTGFAAVPAMPFDWTITTRSFLIAALETDGALLNISENEACVYTMPYERGMNWP